MCFVRLTIFDQLLRQMAGVAHAAQSQQANHAAAAVRANLAKLLEPYTNFFAAVDPIVPEVATVVYQTVRDADPASTAAFDALAAEATVKDPDAYEAFQDQMRAVTRQMIDCLKHGKRAEAERLRAQLSEMRETLLTDHTDRLQRTMALIFGGIAVPDTGDAGLNKTGVELMRDSTFSVERLDMQTRMSMLRAVQAQSKSRSMSNQPDAGDTVPGPPKQVENALRQLRRLPTQATADGGHTVLIMNPTAACQLRAALPVLKQAALDMDARRRDNKLPEHHVNDLEVTEQQLEATEQLFAQMQELEVPWQHGLPLVLPWLQLDAATLAELDTESAKTILVKMMPRTADGACTIKYQTCMRDGQLEVPLRDMHEDEIEKSDVIEESCVRFLVLSAPGSRARCSVGGVFGRPGENEWERCAAALAGAHRGCGDAVLPRATPFHLSAKMHIANVPVVLRPKNTPDETAHRLKALFGYAGESFAVTQGDLTRAKLPGGWFSNLALPGALPNENPHIFFVGEPQAPEVPVYIRLSPYTRPQLPKLLELPRDVPPALLSVMLKLDPMVDEAVIAEAHMRAKEELKRLREAEEAQSQSGAGSRPKRGRAEKEAEEDGPAKPSFHVCLLLNKDGAPVEAKVIDGADMDTYLDMHSFYAYNAGMQIVCKSSTEFMVDGKLQSGESALMKALGVTSLDRIALIGVLAKVRPVLEIRMLRPWTPVGRSEVTTGSHESVPCMRFQTAENEQINFRVRPLCNFSEIKISYVNANGEEEPEDSMRDVGMGDDNEMPFPLIRSVGCPDVDGWVFGIGTRKRLHVQCVPEAPDARPGGAAHGDHQPKRTKI